MRIGGQPVDLVRYWWSMAEQALASARRELDAGAHPFAIGRLQQAAYYGIYAALLDRQVTLERDSAVRVAFMLRFIRTGLLEAEWAKFYDQLVEDRQEAESTAHASFDRPYVEAQLARCGEFLEQLRPLFVAAIAEEKAPADRQLG